MGNDHEIQIDIAVIGYGGAGATAAITARDNGANVIILEKMPTGGGNTVLSTGILLVPKEQEAIHFVEALCFGTTSTEIIKSYINGSMMVNEWIKELGSEAEIYNPLDPVYPPRFPNWPHFPAVEHMELRRVTGPVGEKRGITLWRLLTGNVEHRGIQVMTNTQAKELVTNQQGEVIGVVAERDGQEISIQTKKGVILTCGGFEYNEDMRNTYLPLTPTYPSNHPGNAGDGIVMAQKAGAALWHMSSFSGGYTFKAPEYTAGFSLYFHNPSYIFVDKDGRRFADETGWETHNMWRMFMVFMRLHSNHPHLPAYAIFDDTVRRKGPLSGVILSSVNEYKWSLDNSEEIAKGWIKKSKTINDLARQISIDEVILANTVAEYNEYCDTGRDVDWNRSKETLEPIKVAPYYAIEIWPSMGVTSGGPRRDKEARVLNNQGQPVPRLYSAGELGSIWGSLSTAGCNLMDAIVFGRIAGQNAANEEPWS